MHIRKTYKQVAKRPSSFLQLFEGLDGRRSVNESNYTQYVTTYGEITEQGIHQCSKFFQKYLPLEKVQVQNRTFYDLGCGVGKFVIGMSFLHPQIRSIGIEVVKERVQEACIALSRVASKSIQQRCGFCEGSFLDPKFSYTNACYIFISNLCFREDTQRALVEKLGRELPMGAVLICSKALTNAPENGFELKEEAQIPMTWTVNSQIRIYQKAATTA